MIALEDTIAAIATAPGPAGLAVVRLSGPQALEVAGAVFRGPAPLAAAASHTLHHGWAVCPDSGERLDEVVAAVFRRPRSYTREDVVEISCHGGGEPSRRVLAAVLAAGARLARPGEFTMRAFLNGRLDLTQAEAVADLIHSRTDQARRQALAQLAGALSRQIEALGERVADAAAEVEARVDFAEDVGGIEVPGHVVDAIRETRAGLERLLGGAAYGRALRDGVRVPIVGRPNVGKSSLFNALVGEERSIVTELPGTTRDRVSESVDLAGMLVTFSDTAGLRATADPVEAIGVSLAEQAIEDGAVVLWVMDASEPIQGADRAIAERLLGRASLVALNKHDRPRSVGPGDLGALLDGARARAVEVSALEKTGLDELRGALIETIAGGSAPEHALVSNSRQAEALGRARASLARAEEAAGAGEPGEIVALELREALAALGEVTGRTAGEDLLDRIFSRFCIGK